MRVALALLLAVPALAQQETAKVSYDRDVRPILSQYCFACHGPGSHEETELRLDTRDRALAAIVPGKPAESDLLRRIAKGSMPRKKTGK